LYFANCLEISSSSDKSGDKSKSKRHPVHKRPSSSDPSPDDNSDSCEEDEPLPDEQDLDFLEDLYIKGGEMGELLTRIQN
jgi:hypothetical protein